MATRPPGSADDAGHVDDLRDRSLGELACLTLSRRSARNAAIAPKTTATIRAANQAGMTAFRARMKQAVRAPRAARPMAAAPPNIEQTRAEMSETVESVGYKAMCPPEPRRK